MSFFPVTRKADAVKKMEEHDLLMPKEIVQSYEAIVKSRIDQLTNNRDFATVSSCISGFMLMLPVLLYHKSNSYFDLSRSYLHHFLMLFSNAKKMYP